ncbi:MAG: hypothetical protein ABJ215_08680 [Alphaproteobacteria bacterium]
MTATPYPLEMENVAIDGDGVRDFFWPVPVGSHKPMRDAAAAQLVAGLRETAGSDSLADQAFFLLAHHFFIDALSLFQASLVTDAFRQAGREPLPPSRGRALAAVLNETAPPAPSIIWHLQNGPGAPRLLRAPLRLARDLMMRDGIIRRRLSGPDYETEIIALGVDEVMAAHARSIDTPVTFRRPHLWFTPRETDLSLVDAPALDRAVEKGMAAFNAGYAAGSTCSPAFLETYLREWLHPAMALIVAHLRDLETCGTPIPAQLWTGSGGNIWSRLLRHAVRQRGGRVVAHDHGAGSGQFTDEWFKNIVEFDTCDHFVSFTPTQAEGLAGHFRPDLLVRADTPTLEGLPAAATKAPPVAGGPKDKPTVMVLSSFFFGDWVTYQAFMPDVPFLDWEARLLAKLKEWDFPTLYKPHPLIVTRSPMDMAPQFGARELNQPSEKVIHQADVLILPDPSSTAFATALSTDRPAVFADFGLFKFRAPARALLEERCACVPVALDADNRPQPDWDALRNAILGAHEHTNTAYADSYYGAVYRT